MRVLAVVLIYMLSAPFAEARIFDYKDSALAAYMRGTGGLSSVKQDAFGNSSGSGTSVDGSSKLDYGGEVGMMLGFGQNLHMRLGIEMIQHQTVSGTGSSPSGVERFKLESSVFVFNPNVTFEYVYKTISGFRFYTAIGAGLADVTVENRYTMSASTDLSVPSYNEKLQGSGVSGHALVGMETLFVDNVTFALDLGYRYMPISSFKYKGDVNNFVAPTGASKGAEALNADGNKRALDLGGVIVGASFRFYLNFL